MRRFELIKDEVVVGEGVQFATERPDREGPVAVCVLAREPEVYEYAAYAEMATPAATLRWVDEA